MQWLPTVVVSVVWGPKVPGGSEILSSWAYVRTKREDASCFSSSPERRPINLGPAALLGFPALFAQNNDAVLGSDPYVLFA